MKSNNRISEKNEKFKKGNCVFICLHTLVTNDNFSAFF